MRTYEGEIAGYGIVTGTLKTIIPKIRHVLEYLRPGSILFWDGDGAMTHEESMRSLRLMGSDVIPTTREIGNELGLFGAFEVSPVTGETLSDSSLGDPNKTPVAVNIPVGVGGSTSTNGMTVPRLIAAAFLAVLVAALSACATIATAESTPSLRPPLVTARITADQAAHAMQTDSFFADYGQMNLLIQGTIANVGREGADSIITLGTNRPTTIACDLGSGSTNLRVGDQVTIRSTDPRRDAERQASRLLLRNCSPIE